MRAEKENARARRPRHDALGNLEAIGSGHVDVHNHDIDGIGPGLFNKIERRIGRVRRPDHLKQLRTDEQTAEHITNESVIVNEDNPCERTVKDMFNPADHSIGLLTQSRRLSPTVTVAETYPHARRATS